MSMRIAVLVFAVSAVAGGLVFAGQGAGDRRRQPRHDTDDWGALFI